MKLSKHRIVLLIAAAFIVTAYILIQFVYNNQQKSKAGGEVVALSFSPSAQTTTGTQLLSADILATPSADMSVQTYAFAVGFDTSALRVTSIIYHAGTVSEGLGDTTDTLTEINTKGKIIIAGESQNATGIILQKDVPASQKIATIQFQVLSQLPSLVSISATGPQTLNNVFTKISPDSPNQVTPIPITSAYLSLNGGESPPVPSTTLTPSPTSSLSQCTPVNKRIIVVPQDVTGCHDLQQAVDAVDGEGYIIHIDAGKYTLGSHTDPSYAQGTSGLVIKDKKNLAIIGEVTIYGVDGQPLDPNIASKLSLVTIAPGKTNYGIIWENSSGFMQFVTMERGGVDRSAISIRNSQVDLIYNTFVDVNREGYTGVTIAIQESNYTNSSGLMFNYFENVVNPIVVLATTGLSIEYNEFIGNAKEAITLSGGGDISIEYNLFHQNTGGESVILMKGGTGNEKTGYKKVAIIHNTIVENAAKAFSIMDLPIDAIMPKGFITFNNNIVVGNSKGGLSQDTASAIEVTMVNNDVWSNTPDIDGKLVSKIGKNGNISKDPLFGEEYCLSQNSPALLKDDFMGHRGQCDVRPTPPPLPSYIPTLPPVKPPVKDSVTLDLRLSFQGITTAPKGAVKQMTVKVTVKNPLFNVEQETTAEIVPVSDKPGMWAGKTLPLTIPLGPGYTVLVKGSKHVQKKYCIENPNETATGTYRCGIGRIQLLKGVTTLDFSKAVILAGDIPDQNGMIDSYDVSYIRSNLGAKDEKALSVGDINLDGVVDTQDYSLVLQSLNIKYDEE